MAQSNLPVLSTEGGLSRYLQEIRKFPMLEPDEEFMLAKRYKEHADPGAMAALVALHGRIDHRQRHDRDAQHEHPSLLLEHDAFTIDAAASDVL